MGHCYTKPMFTLSAENTSLKIFSLYQLNNDNLKPMFRPECPGLHQGKKMSSKKMLNKVCTCSVQIQYDEGQGTLAEMSVLNDHCLADTNEKIFKDIPNQFFTPPLAVDSNQ